MAEDQTSTSPVEEPPEGGRSHFGDEVWQQLLTFASLLEDEGQIRGLVGPREMGRLWGRHIMNSTAISEFIPKDSSVADVGSGAGFPGVVLAITRPDVHVHLIESIERRVDWLLFSVERLGLSNVTIHRSRAEDMPERFKVDIATARAVAALKKLIPWTLPLLRSGGSLVALKGERAELEIDDASAVLRKYGAEWVDVHDVDVWGTDEGTRVVVVKKA